MPNHDNISLFHALVSEKRELLRKEFEHIKFLVDNARAISTKLNQIDGIFGNMIFMKGEVAKMQDRALGQEVKTFRTGLDDASQKLELIWQDIEILEKAIKLVKKESGIMERVMKLVKREQKVEER